MGGFLSNVARLMKTYNIEHRALKSLSEDRKVVPPKHPTTAPLIEKMRTEYADKYEELLKKDPSLDTNLKKVYVKSTSYTELLPRDTNLFPKRTRYESPFEYGYEDPETVPPGRHTLTQVIKILSDYHTNREEVTAKHLALKYNLDEKHMANLIDYYKLFKLGRRPDKKKTLIGTSFSKKADLGIRNIKRISNPDSVRHKDAKLESGESKES